MFTPEQIEIMEECYRNMEQKKVWAQKLGITSATLNYRLKHSDLPEHIKNYNRIKELNDKVRKFVEKNQFNMSTPDMAKELGVGINIVRKYLSEDRDVVYGYLSEFEIKPEPPFRLEYKPFKFTSDKLSIRVPTSDTWKKFDTYRLQIIKEYEHWVLFRNLENGLKETFIRADLNIWNTSGLIEELH